MVISCVMHSKLKALAVFSNSDNSNSQMTHKLNFEENLSLKLQPVEKSEVFIMF